MFPSKFPSYLRPPRPPGIDYVRLHPVRGSPLYTLHIKDKHDFFALHLEKDDQTSRTCIVVFLQMQDAMIYGKLLERHRKAAGNWPGLTSSTPKIDLLIQNDSLETSLDELYVQTWTEEELQDFCVSLIASMLIFHEVRVTQNNGLKIDMRAELAETEVADTEMRRKFQEIYDQI